MRLSHRLDLTTEQQPLFDALKTKALTTQTSFADECADRPARPHADTTPDLVERLEVAASRSKKPASTAMNAVLPDFEAFYDSLTDEQKAGLMPSHDARPPVTAWAAAIATIAMVRAASCACRPPAATDPPTPAGALSRRCERWPSDPSPVARPEREGSRLVAPRREPFLWATERLGIFDPSEPQLMSTDLPLDPARIRAEFPSFRQAGTAGLCLFRECRRLVHLGRRAQPDAQLLLEQQGPALRLLRPRPRRRQGDGGILPPHRAGDERRRRLDPFRSLDLGQHLHPRARLRELAAARRRHRRHQPGSRGQFRRLAQARLARRRDPRMAGRQADRPSRSQRPRQAARQQGAPRLHAARLQHRRRDQPGRRGGARRPRPSAP